MLHCKSRIASRPYQITYSSMTPLFPTLFAIAARRFRIAASTLFALSLYLPAAQAGVSYQMDQPQAAAGQTIRISRILFNVTDKIGRASCRERVCQYV